MKKSEFRRIIREFIRESHTIDELNWKQFAGSTLAAASLMIDPDKAVADVKPQTQTTQQIKYPYTIEDIIAATLVDEAGGEKDAEKGMHAVLNVIMKRGKGNLRSAARECIKPLQFSGWNKVNKSDINSVKGFIDSKRKHAKYSVALKLVSQAKDGSLKDITNGADHFLNINLTKSQRSSLPKWYDKKKVTVNVGNHTFLKLT